MKPPQVHPLVPEFQEELRKGRITRRDFLRFSMLLGLSFAGAQALAACTPSPEPTVQPTPLPPTATPQPAVNRGGKVTVMAHILPNKHPSAFTGIIQAQVWRNVFDYLCETDTQGLTRPALLEKLEPSADLKTWTLTLRKGVKFNDGRELTVDDILFTMQQWFDPTVGCYLPGMMNYLDLNNVEETDPYTLVCHLKKPSIFLPEHLALNPAMILPITFEGDVTQKAVGTGPFTVAEFAVMDHCRLVRRNDYWRKGIDGSPLPYLDEVLMIHHAEKLEERITALKNRTAEILAFPAIEEWKALKDEPGLQAPAVPTSASWIFIMVAAKDPWKDNRVRQALKHCLNRERLLAEVLSGQGEITNDTHVTRSHPEYVELPGLAFDPQKAKALLAEAGYPDGLTIDLPVLSDISGGDTFIGILKEDAAAAGFKFNPTLMSFADLIPNFPTVNTVLVFYTHFATALMSLSLYQGSVNGQPNPTNWTGWSDPEFDQLFLKGESQLDLSARRDIVGELEKIMIERGAIGMPFTTITWAVYDDKIQGFEANPNNYANLHAVWKKA